MSDIDIVVMNFTLNWIWMYHEHFSPHCTPLCFLVSNTQHTDYVPETFGHDCSFMYTNCQLFRACKICKKYVKYWIIQYWKYFINRKCTFTKSQMLFTKSQMLFTKSRMLFTKSQMLFTKSQMLFTKSQMLFTKSQCYLLNCNVIH